ADNSIERWSRVTGLSETGISTIRYDEANGKLMIAYSNSNIDIVEKGEVRNIPDIKRDNIIGDKTIYNIYPQGKYYYLSTGLGIIVIDGDRYEVKESWFIGAGGNQVKVTGFTGDGTFYYAASAEGLKRAAVNANLPDFSSWQLLSGSNGLSSGPCQNVFFIDGKLVVQKNDSLFVQNGVGWSLFYADGWPLVSSNATGGKIELCERQANGTSRVILLNPDATIARTLVQAAVISFPRKAIFYENETWIADQFGGLSRFSATSFEQYKLNSPEATASGEMLVYNETFYASAGEVNDAWNYQYNGNGFYIFKAGIWENINRFRFPVLDSLLDFITIAVDRRDESVWVGSYGGGLLEVKPGNNFGIYKQNFLEQAIGDPGSYRVAGLAFDTENNLWISNYGAAQPLRVRKNDGSWQSFSIPFLLNENALAQILVDENGYKWIVSPKGNGLICYDHGTSVDNTGDDRWRIFRAGGGNGNLPSSEIHVIAKDKNGYIWVGTGDGIAVIQCGQDVFSAQGCEAILPVIQQGNFANFLFRGEEIRAIAVDGADRKWVATKNGAWLVDPVGEKIILQFTETNSPLLSSDVKKIAIDGNTGEVYFATLKGICSFRGTATEGAENNSDLLVFPNPVPPGFTGFITIRGLVNNAVVKITELNGRLVWQGRALGGQAVWDGRNYKGQKIASGVYLVLVSDDGRTEKSAGKIVFVAR
ncbi:MAG TPA: two-component regulator propeller domain-containing protein, partial [Chitinophagaceae bacterium]|nr:two-component regulator propeller domain-containing protein [Chitinophagaceae bacterium]